MVGRVLDGWMYGPLGDLRVIGMSGWVGWWREGGWLDR